MNRTANATQAGAPPRIDPSALVHDRAFVGGDTAVWHLAQVREDARIGEQCVIGRGVYVGAGVRIGDRVKIQNYALVYEPALVEDGVFVGPAVVFTNDRHPRAITAEGDAKSAADWTPVGVVVKYGASIGAGAVCVAPVTIGRWALVAAGSVVTRDVPDFALVAGNPARRVGWVGRAAVPLVPLGGDLYKCPQTGVRYVKTGDAPEVLEEIHP
ncbi:acyltransferase [Actinospica acidithermotolerans]|uniref:acyltransferase n=1 Tax=Actinospica acidithermotolerans TaxID=2828514 RepID=UPI0027DC8006|nr:acyltransferase [Actinospica acidithermotolerans]